MLTAEILLVVPEIHYSHVVLCDSPRFVGGDDSCGSEGLNDVELLDEDVLLSHASSYDRQLGGDRGGET